MTQYTEVTLEMPVPRSLWPPKIPHVLLCDRKLTSAVRRKENSQYFHAFLTHVLELMNGQPYTHGFEVIYKDGTKEFHILKMTQTKNRAHLELQTRVSRQRNSQSFVTDGQVNVVTRHYCQTSLVWQMATPTKKELVCPSVGEERGTTAVKVHFSHNLTRDQTADIPFTLDARHLGKKGAFAKGSVLVCLVCLVQLCTLSRLTVEAAHKNQCDWVFPCDTVC